MFLKKNWHQFGHLATIVAFSWFLAASSSANSDVPIVQPGAPGDANRQLSAEEAVDIARTSHSPDDTKFMQDMIPHHNQAVQMSALVADRTNRPEILDLAGRIDASQQGEIEFMQQWLRERGEEVPDPTAHHAMHMDHKMAGMASREQMAELATLQGTDFDRLFLQLMIPHHEGAITMVEELLEQPGAAYDPILFEFTSDIVNDQAAEIERMNALLGSLSADPRASLSPGFVDAGEAILNMKLIAAMRKPAGFFDPANPLEAPAKAATDEDEEEQKEEDNAPIVPRNGKTRSPMLSFANTDMAFAGDVLVAGNYHGFNVYQLQDDGVPALTASIVCPGGQGDVSIVGNLLIMSVQETRSRLDCGLEGVSEDVSPDRFRGIRIFDISDPTNPKQVGLVQTCRGSHTHSVVSGPGEEGKIIVYNSGTSTIREQEEMESCFDELPGDERTALFRIDVIEIPVDDPASSRIVDSPAVFADPESGALAGLWRGGDHGDETQESTQTDECHDITVFPDAGIAAGACSGNGIIFDISDPRKPTRIDAVVDDGFAYWHSATFNNDGTKVLFTDEWGGGSFPRCRSYDPLTWGADAIYDIVDGKLEFRSYFKMPAPQLDVENCVAHNGSIVPVPGRDIFVQAWYQGGISVIDFTDSENPFEIAYFDRGPLDADTLILGGYWSVYWYNGLIYGTEILRGLDVLDLLPSEHLTANEIAAAKLADQGDVFNPQQQFRVSWPAEPAVALAYMDQLLRDGVLSTESAAGLSALLERAAPALAAGSADADLASEIIRLTRAMPQTESTGRAAARRSALEETLRAIADRLT
ncbi:MAG: DUF305 domain-containing protein [Woeseiaceae bacterium]|nr:DUF305 domain-containing protein [Woeseiaceae bacterium]